MKLDLAGIGFYIVASGLCGKVWSCRRVASGLRHFVSRLSRSSLVGRRRRFKSSSSLFFTSLVDLVSRVVLSSHFFVVL